MGGGRGFEGADAFISVLEHRQWLMRAAHSTHTSRLTQLRRLSEGGGAAGLQPRRDPTIKTVETVFSSEGGDNRALKGPRPQRARHVACAQRRQRAPDIASVTKTNKITPA